MGMHERWRVCGVGYGVLIVYIVGWMRVLRSWWRSLFFFFFFYKGGRATSFFRSRSRCQDVFFLGSGS